MTRTFYVYASAVFFCFQLSAVCEAGLVLQLDAAANASIINVGSVPIDFDGYTIHCELSSGTGCASSSTWLSIEDQVAADAVDVLGRLGAGALGFAEANPSAKQLSEITLGAGALLQPNDRLQLGQPIVPSSTVEQLIASNELSWEWTSATLGSTPSGVISAVPEPSAFQFGCLCILLIAARQYFASRNA